MALIDVVRYELNDRELVYKFPFDDLCIGSKLIVYQSQTAFFVKGGKVCDEFKTGTYTIDSKNIPILSSFINLPFGGETPFKAEVWFVNQTTKLDMKWGTPQPIMLKDPEYGIIVPVRAFGQYGVKISNPRLFMESLIGNMTSFNTDKLNEYFRSKIIGQLNNLVAEKLVYEKVSVLEINAHLLAMSEYCKSKLTKYFMDYGVELVDFTFMSVSIPQDDPSLNKLKETMEKAAQLKIIGKDFYQMDRSFDVMEKAASNEGSIGTVANMGMGLGLGVNMGNQMGTMMNNNVNSTVTPPPMPRSSTTYYLGIDGKQVGPIDEISVRTLIANGTINSETLVWKQGMANWQKISSLIEFSSLCQTCPPPMPSM